MVLCVGLVLILGAEQGGTQYIQGSHRGTAGQVRSSPDRREPTVPTELQALHSMASTAMLPGCPGSPISWEMPSVLAHAFTIKHVLVWI